MNEKFEIQADQYRFPYHYLVDLESKEFRKNLDWGLDYYTYMNKVSDLVKKYVTTDILDVGCGDGFMLNTLGRDPAFPSDVQAVGIDIDEKPIRFAQAFAHDLPNVTFMAQDIATYSEQFGLVTAVETLEHIPDEMIDDFVAHMDRLLRPGGFLIISVPSKARPVLEKHYRHYDLPMIRNHFSGYVLREVHYVTDRSSLAYQVASFLLSKRYVSLNFTPFRPLLLGLHQRFSSEASPERGAHVVTVLEKQ